MLPALTIPSQCLPPPSTPPPTPPPRPPAQPGQARSLFPRRCCGQARPCSCSSLKSPRTRLSGPALPQPRGCRNTRGSTGRKVLRESAQTWKNNQKGRTMGGLSKLPLKQGGENRDVPTSACCAWAGLKGVGREGRPSLGRAAPPPAATCPSCHPLLPPPMCLSPAPVIRAQHPLIIERITKGSWQGERGSGRDAGDLRASGRSGVL